MTSPFLFPLWTHSSPASEHFFSPKYRPAMFSAPSCCLHPSKFSVLLPLLSSVYIKLCIVSMLMYAGVCVCLCACVRLEQSTDNSLRFTNNFIIVTDSESTLQNELVFFFFSIIPKNTVYDQQTGYTLTTASRNEIWSTYNTYSLLMVEACCFKVYETVSTNCKLNTWNFIPILAC